MDKILKRINPNNVRILDEKHKCNFIEDMNKNGGRLEFITTGVTGVIYKFYPTNSDDNFVLKIIPYQSKCWKGTTEINSESHGRLHYSDPTRPENVEHLMMAFLSTFINSTPHITLSPYAFICDWDQKDVKTLFSVNDVTRHAYINNYMKLKNGDYYWDKDCNSDKILLLLAEWAEQGDFKQAIEGMVYRAKKSVDIKDLDKEDEGDVVELDKEEEGIQAVSGSLEPKLLEKDRVKLKVLLFQILYTMSIIVDKDPSWRHNDFKPDNILIQDDKSEYKYAHYNYKNGNYMIPNIGSSVRLWDFDFSDCDTVPNDKVRGGQYKDSYGITNINGSAYDLYYLFDIIYGDLFDYLSKPMLNFLWRVVCIQGQGGTTTNGRLKFITQDSINRYKYETLSYDDKTSVPYINITPSYLLAHPIFDEFKVKTEEVPVNLYPSYKYPI